MALKLESHCILIQFWNSIPTVFPRLKEKVQSTISVLVTPSLNVYLLLLAFRLLMQSGDIESNPGPTGKEMVNCSILYELIQTNSQICLNDVTL